MLGSSSRNIDFALSVARGDMAEASSIHKFGEASSIQTADGFADIWDGVGNANADANYTFSTTADIDTISSSNVNDTQDIQIQGLDTNWALTTQTVTLNGQTKVTLGTSLIRVFRMKNVNSTDIAGTVYCYVDGTITNGVPDTSADVRAIIEGDNNQTLMAIYTIPANQTGYLTKGFITIAKKVSVFASFKMKIRESGGVFQLKETGQINSTGSSSFMYEYPIPLKIPEKSDIIVQADVSSNDTAVSAAFDILLLDTQ